ncbi:MAG: peptidase S8 [Candidatus Aminicenantes bacterium]|nr:peptidase S8 [Candidatus Aminicenantes bacterium]
MKRIPLLILSFLIFLLSVMIPGNISAIPGQKYDKILSYKPTLYHSDPLPFSENKILVRFKQGSNEARIQGIIQAASTRSLKRISALDLFVLELDPGTDVNWALTKFRHNPQVLYAEPNYRIRLAETPNDTLFNLQYSLYNTNTIPGSTPPEDRADIHAPEAWEETKGDQAVLIGILDTGVDLLHPDLNDKIIDSGRDYVNDDFDATDDHGHGTHAAGIAAAETNNAEGIAGVAWNCKILPVKVLDNTGVGEYDMLIQGIIYAADQGVHVINMSLGGDFPSQGLADALQYAYDKGIVCVASTGNDGGGVLYPAAYDDTCLAVAATNANDERPDWSNFGPEVDVAAPGVNIWSCVPTWLLGSEYLPYQQKSGTSMSSPHVAGLAALIKSLKPWLSASDIMNIICYSAEDINSDELPGKDQFLGYGRINMENALVPIIITMLLREENI